MGEFEIDSAPVLVPAEVWEKAIAEADVAWAVDVPALMLAQKTTAFQSWLKGQKVPEFVKKVEEQLPVQGGDAPQLF